MSNLQRQVSSQNFAGTVAALEAEIERRGMQLFARIDHADNASGVGLSMPPTTVLVFGNARGGTPAMLNAPSLAYELPLRLLIREEADQVLIEFRRPEDVAGEYELPPELAAPLKVINDVAAVV
jgi:uncharacterized protein (DUF302 family)